MASVSLPINGLCVRMARARRAQHQTSVNLRGTFFARGAFLVSARLPSISEEQFCVNSMGCGVGGSFKGITRAQVP